VLNVAIYRNALPRRVILTAIGDRPVSLYPLARPEIDRIHFQARISDDEPMPHVVWRFMAGILAVAARDGERPVATLDEWLTLTPKDVAACFDEWRKVQDASMPNVDSLDAYLELCVADGTGEIFDLFTVAHCQTPTEFYGTPPVSLTDGQLAYYFTARAVYHRTHDSSEGKTTCINKARLLRRLQAAENSHAA
jgi:hypothetical protein